MGFWNMKVEKLRNDSVWIFAISSPTDDQLIADAVALLKEK